ncbi:putative peptidyl-prolyl cis-trans isomerase [Gordonia polyisoprenivorans VH2]|uniref:Putative peptidyl-prolyl cis-trans isomerase n=1 Tax=Gordonia polyisoprenivorans (strain DSM 44266 / VH2) TaxID=1112204 RepID=H6N0N5_GORPV|nr:peptidylprolyl isomerase [Gordonia polyisoprenivorans]AFA73247.1 putative peptidyl-prolyl cis-trans isomerase [Gordonia polyisoprenivorans VH2]
MASNKEPEKPGAHNDADNDDPATSSPTGPNLSKNPSDPAGDGPADPATGDRALTNEQRREAAKRKLEERLERERAAARKRKVLIGSVSGVVVIAVLATATYFIVDKIQTDRFNASHTTCDYVAKDSNFKQIPTTVPAEITDPAQRALYQEQIDKVKAGESKQKTAPMPDKTQAKDGTSTLTLTTTQGVVPVDLNRTGAPCNTGAVISLADHGYYDNSPCHRMTTAALKVLQCGDPTGTGLGQPGWTSPDEPPTDLKPSGQANPMTGQQAVTYPRGTVAIANSGSAQQGEANSGGSAQFFILIQDGTLPASYAVVGTVVPDGMKVIDKVFAGGVNPGIGPNQTTGAYERTADDGSPKLPITIETAKVS